MGIISRVEPVVELIEAREDYFPTFENVGWLNLLHMFNGHNAQVTKDFARTFNGEHAKIGDTKLNLDEETIARATKFPLKGEFWSKTKRVKEIP
jgi:hypothetical protein